MRLIGGLAVVVAVMVGMTALSGQGRSLAPSAVEGLHEWRDYAGGPDSSRFVGATQITKANVGRLQVAWTYPDGDTDFNPLMVRGVVYTRARGNTLVALDAATGTQLWASAEIKAFTTRTTLPPAR